MTIKEAITKGLADPMPVTLEGVTVDEVETVATEMGYDCWFAEVPAREWNGGVGYTSIHGWPPNWDAGAENAHELVWGLRLV